MKRLGNGKYFVVMSLFLLLLDVKSCNSLDDFTKNEVEKIILSIEKVLDFIEEYYYQINLDGALGITLAQAQIEQIVFLENSKSYTSILNDILEKVQYLKEKILPLLPDIPLKSFLFKQILLQPKFWHHETEFVNGKLDDLGIYHNWTSNYILDHKGAKYNNIGTDVCMEEVLKESYGKNEYQNCYISPFCLVMMFGHRTDTLYLLTHRLLYLQIARQINCIVDTDITGELIQNYCSLIWKEARTNEYLGFPQHDIFLEQVVLCGIEGFAEFSSRQLREIIRNWQTRYGCYKAENDNLNSLRRRTTNIIEFGCTDHSTGLGLASLSLNLRYLLTSGDVDLF